MKKYLTYNGDKPYIFAAFAESDEAYAEQIIDKLAPKGYRLWIEDKGAADSVTHAKLVGSHVALFVLSEEFISDPPCYRLLQKAEAAHRSMLVYVPVDTPAVKEVLLRLIRTPEMVLIFRPGEEVITDSKTANVMLDPTLGLTPELAMKVYRKGVRLFREGKRKKGLEYIELAAGENCAKAILWLGKSALEAAEEGRSGYAPAVRNLSRAAKLGDTEAIFILGKMLADGVGFERDTRLAYTYILKSAQHGYSPAQLTLAMMYDRGNGTDIDKKQATRWYLAAAAKGESEAFMPLGIRYLDGRYLPKDEEQAVKYLKRSAASGNREADVVLAKLYRDGTGVARDPARAAKHFKVAAESGVCEAQYFYAICLRNALGCERDKEKAFYWMKRAADDRNDGTEGSPDAMYQLGVFYEKGVGCKKDKKKAFICYYSAAKMGHEESIRAVSECYRRGIGVSVNRRAAALYRSRLTPSKATVKSKASAPAAEGSENA